jgi:hypothetical protein
MSACVLNKRTNDKPFWDRLHSHNDIRDDHECKKNAVHYAVDHETKLSGVGISAYPTF